MKKSIKAFWEDYKERHLDVSIFMVIVFMSILCMSLSRGDEVWYYSFIFLFIGVVVVPIASYIEWKKKGGL